MKKTEMRSHLVQFLKRNLENGTREFDINSLDIYFTALLREEKHDIQNGEINKALLKVSEMINECVNSNMLMRGKIRAYNRELIIVTEEGVKILQKIKKEEYGDFNALSIKLKNVVKDEDLREVCRVNFENKAYWDAVFVASRHIEEVIRKLCKFDNTYYGENLVNEAFSSNNGLLKIPGCATPAEEQGIYFIIKGIMLFHRNAKGHRKGTIDKSSTIKILGYFDYILSLIKIAEKKDKMFKLRIKNQRENLRDKAIKNG